MKKYICVLMLVLSFTIKIQAQTATTWNGKSCAVVLTYDDAIDVDLDNAIPALDSLKLKATFYLSGYSGVINNRMEEWRAIAKNGHELANHTLFHPCEGGRPGREFVSSETDLTKYSLTRVTNEIRMTNTLLKAIDGKVVRTFAYPCGDMKIGDSLYLNSMHHEIVAARGVQPGLQKINEVDLYNIRCYGINGQPGDYLIDLVKKAMDSHTLLVFLFHGVGGGHALNVSLDAHSQLLHFLQQHQKNIWVAPMLEVATYIQKQQSQF